jgi:hypothetical protein
LQKICKDNTEGSDINYEKFLNKVENYSIKYDIAEKNFILLAKAIDAYGLSIREVFNQFDLNEDSQLYIKEFNKAYKGFNIEITEEEILQMFMLFEHRGKDYIVLSDFMRYFEVH